MRTPGKTLPFCVFSQGSGKSDLEKHRQKRWKTREKKWNILGCPPFFADKRQRRKNFGAPLFHTAKFWHGRLWKTADPEPEKWVFHFFHQVFHRLCDLTFHRTFFTPFWHSNGFFTFRKPVFTQFSGLFHNLLKTLWKPVEKRLEISLCLRSCGNLAGLMSGCPCRASFDRDTRRSCYALHYSALLNSQRSLVSYLLARQGNRSRSAYGYPHFLARR